MAASGVTVQDKVVTEYNNMKLGRQYQCIVMKLTKDDKEIELEKTIPANACTFEDFVSQLPNDDCRYAVYDFHFETPNAGQRQQLILILWCPETANIRRKMIYASSKDAMKKKLVGITNDFQATEYSELTRKDVTEKLLQKMVK